MKIAIDSSTLISLAKINALHFLKKKGEKMMCSSSVYEETVNQALLDKFEESIRLSELFNESHITVVNNVKNREIKGISSTDAEIISLAMEEKATLYANDTKLAAKAREQGLNTYGSADILLMALRKKHITKNEFCTFLGNLVKTKRLSEKNMDVYVKEAEKWQQD